MNSVEDLCSLITRAVTPTSSRRAGRALSVPIEPDTRLLDLGILDSLAVLSVVSEIEQTLDLEFPETEIVATNFRTPENLWKFVSTLRTQVS